jgi:hypothetical protein
METVLLQNGCHRTGYRNFALIPSCFGVVRRLHETGREVVNMKTAIAASVILCAAALMGLLMGQPQKNEPVKLISSIQGPDLYRAYCASCHGTDAKGGGPMAPALKTKPPDLTRIAIRNNGIFPMQRVQKVIAGEELTGLSHGSREMPVWGPIFSQVEEDMDRGRVRIDNLVRYLRGIQAMK